MPPALPPHRSHTHDRPLKTGFFVILNVVNDLNHSDLRKGKMG